MASTPDWLLEGGVDLDKSLLEAQVSGICDELRPGASEDTHVAAAKALHSLILYAWSLDTCLARDAADIICDYVRVSGGLDSLMQLCTTTKTDLKMAVLNAIEQIMVTENRKFISSHKLFDHFVKIAKSNESIDLMRVGTGILENLFKDSTDTCLRLIRANALEGLILGCRSTDSVVLQHCAAGLANCAMYGESRVHSAMVSKFVDHWLFPLAFSTDEVVKYYALFAICFMASDPQFSNKVAESGTLDLVLPFLNSHNTDSFARSCPNHAHGKSSDWLKRLLPFLSSPSEQARSLVAFHFAMETKIKHKQHRLNVFDEINAYEPLKYAAERGSRLTAKYCMEALTICCRGAPKYQCWNVVNWTKEEVSCWVKTIMGKFMMEFYSNRVNGSTLLDLTSDDLMELGFKNKVHCKWFLGEVAKLRCLADSGDKGTREVTRWLTSISEDMAIYKPDFMRNNVTKSILPYLTDDVLEEIGVNRKVDRLRIRLSINEQTENPAYDTPDQGGPRKFSLPTEVQKRKYDVFISYRRANGSQLASLLKVHLQLRGLTVFLDVAELGSGKFDEAILTTIAQSKNFLLVLTENCLDRCKGDVQMQDWLHREIVSALDKEVHAVPVIESKFQWPKEKELPGDIEQIGKWNGVLWSHEYQEACVEKLVNFLKVPATIDKPMMAPRMSLSSLPTI